MRLLFLLILLSVVSLDQLTGQSNERYDIRLQVEGLEDSVAYLGYHFGEKRYYQDTSSVSPKGEVSFSNTKRLKKGVYFLYSKSFYFEFLVNEQQFSIKTTKSDPYGSMQIHNSLENEVFRVFQLMMKDHQIKMRSLTEELKQAKNKKDSTSIYEKAEQLGDENLAKRDSLKNLYKEYYAAVLLRLMEPQKQNIAQAEGMSVEEKRKLYNDYKDHFFDGIDFNDEGTLRAPIFHAKVMEYMDKVTFQTPDSVVASVDYILNKSKDSEEMFRYWVVYFFQKYQNSKIMGLDKAFVHISENYYLKGKTPWADEEMLTKLREEMDFHRENQIGMIAPRLNLLDTLQDPISLSSIPANYTILFFYSPDCGHCKKETPVLLDIYHGLQSEGVEVLAVDSDTDIDKWKAFIQEHQLDWVNAADPFTRSNFRRQYNVRTTPTIYVLDRDKRIIAKKLGVEQIESFIKDRIAFDNRAKL
ncbi:thioredoxin-like domain-containing protein [Reichenbachiella sp. MALMAid0571]|uniref:redoxin domain-containing protein n=1 Tax=Reichenbachiella sp. MALMAid0571 TaxID=3143939 RepID=UPI0032DFF489